jgi:hypothetical protein
MAQFLRSSKLVPANQNHVVNIDANEPPPPSIEAGVINAVAHGCWETSESHGFHDDWRTADWLEELATYLEKEERFTTDDTNFPGADQSVSTVDGLRAAAHTLRNNVLGMKLMLMVSELSEAMENIRDHGVAGIMAGEGNFGEELADATIRINDTAGLIRSAIGDEIIQKMLVNEQRPYRHGKKAGV